MMKKILASILVIAAALPGEIFSWTDHTMMTGPVLSSMDLPALKKEVVPEPLEIFLRKEARGLEKLFAEEEAALTGTYENYPPRPEALAFKGEGAEKATAEELRLMFCRALRINPNMKMPLYVYMPGVKEPKMKKFPLKEISLLNDLYWIDQEDIYALKPGEKISAAAVLASGTEEPDLGFDLGLYADNKTDFGQVYGFGTQPFGNPVYEYSSQSPFHMGFYHESSILVLAAGWINRTNPEYRAHIFLALAKYAFSTGHDYWAMRFLGWGCHYVQDLSYPYHSRMVPGVGTVKLMWANLLMMMGFTSLSDEYLNRISQRHTAGENYISRILKTGDSVASENFFQVLRQPLKVITPYSSSYLRQETSKKACNSADDLDGFLADSWSWISVLTGFKAEFTPPTEISETDKLHNTYGVLLENFSESTRAYIHAALE